VGQKATNQKEEEMTGNQEKLYDGRTQEDWLAELAQHDPFNERHLLAMFALFGIPRTYLDIGCGTGSMVNLARRIGTEAYGVDQLKRPDKHFFQHDLRLPFSLNAVGGPSLVNIVTCLEVAEHLPPSHDEILCTTISNHVDRNGLLVFSSAHYGQGGSEHVGTRPAYHWKRKFHDRGFGFSAPDTNMLILLWSNINSPLMWLPANVMVFKR
jgi:hypothetical protein